MTFGYNNNNIAAVVNIILLFVQTAFCASRNTYLERLSHGQVREEDVLLQYVTDAPLAPLVETLAIQVYAPRVQLGPARQTVQQSRFSTSFKI